MILLSSLARWLRLSAYPQLDDVYSLEKGMTKFKSLLEQYRGLYSATELTDEDVQQLSADVRQIIPILEGRCQYWDHRRELFLQLGLGMLAFCIAALAGLAAVFDRLIAHPPTFVVMCWAFTVVATLLVGGLRIVIVWNRQNNPDYPFTKGYDHWRWQYRYAETKKLPFKYRYATESEYEQDIEAYLENMKAYAKKTLSLKPKDILQQDISQLFLLIENEKYKIKFVSELRDTLIKWLRNAFWVGLVSLVILVLVVVFISFENIREYFGGNTTT